MTYRISFSKSASKTVEKWKKSNPSAFRKLREILPELETHPRSGTGHPEALTSGNGKTYSRRITANERIMYDILDEEVIVLILNVGGHYSDK